MNNILSHGSQDFDCSAYLSHGLQWPAKEVRTGCDKTITRTGIQNTRECNAQYIEHKTETAKVRDWGVLLKEEMSALNQQGKVTLLQKDISPIFRDKTIVNNSVEKQYYESEYTTLLKWMDEEEIIVPPPSMFADKREEIQRISLVADEALDCQSYDSSYHYNRPAHGSMGKDRQVHRYLGEDFENRVALKAVETPGIRGVMSHGGFQNFVEEQLVGFGESCTKKDGELKKRRLCRHFVKGFCLRGESCEFLHDASIFCTDEQKVFLGGLPLHMSAQILKDKLEMQGLTVLNRPKIMRGFSPQVCLGSVEQAEMLIAKGFLYLDEHRVDVRPYQDREQLREGLPSIVKRSVFLGGLPEKTTGEMIINDLERLDVKVLNFPVVKNGYAPRVELESLEDAKKLVSLKRLMVNGTAVDVRPYVNFRKRY